MPARLGLTMLFAAALVPVPCSKATEHEEIPFQLRGGFIWVKVRTPGYADPLDFLLDSGASLSVINLRTAEKLGLKAGKRVSVRGVGVSTTGFWPEHLSGTASGVRLAKDYLAVDLSALSGACECPVDGLIGMDFFRGRIVQIDFTSSLIRLLTTAPTAPDQEVLPLQARHGGVRVPVQVNGDAARWVRLDTGCASGLQWVTGHPVPVEHETRVAVALSRVSVSVVRSRVQLGASCFEGVATDLHEKPILAGEAGLLGNGLLSQFGSVTVDAKAGRLILERRNDGS